MELYLSLASGVFPQESVSPSQLHPVLQRGPHVQDALVVPPGPLGALDDGVERVGEVLEQLVLFLHVHPQDPIEKFAHFIVAFVQGENTGTVLTAGDQTHSYQAVSNV